MFSIEVIDIGIGIFSKVLVWFLEFFYQGKFFCIDSDILYFKGIGLGLFVVKKNMYFIGGYLVIVSQLGVGLWVIIVLFVIVVYYVIENLLFEGLYIIMFIEILFLLSGEIIQILDGCELFYYFVVELFFVVVCGLEIDL